MTHSLICIVVKAKEIDEAIEKARQTMDHAIIPPEAECYKCESLVSQCSCGNNEGWFVAPHIDSYCILGHEDKSKPNRWMLDMNHQMEQRGVKVISSEHTKQNTGMKVSRLDTFRTLKEFLEEPDKYNIYDEKYEHFTKDYFKSELPKDYFVVPVDVHQ